MKGFNKSLSRYVVYIWLHVQNVTGALGGDRGAKVRR